MKHVITVMIFCFIKFHAAAQEVLIPNSKPVLFAPGIISTSEGEFAPTFAPDGKTVYFTGGPFYIYVSKFTNNKWNKPEVASFSGKWKDMDPFLSPDGKRLYFSSYRPTDTLTTMAQKFAHIWYVDLLPGNAWSRPKHLDPPVNIDGVNNYAPAVSRSGTLFFFSPNRDINNKSSYKCMRLGDHYSTPVLVDIKGDGGVHDPFIAPGENFLIFVSKGDLYISFNRGAQWSERQKLSNAVNDGNKNSAPSMSPDGKTLYYSSNSKDGILMIPIRVQ